MKVRSKERLAHLGHASQAALQAWLAVHGIWPGALFVAINKGGADGDLPMRWSGFEQLHGFWQVRFERPVVVAQVAIWGRGDGDALVGRLEFDDGTSVDFGTLSPDACRRAVSFTPRVVS